MSNSFPTDLFHLLTDEKTWRNTWKSLVLVTLVTMGVALSTHWIGLSSEFVVTLSLATAALLLFLRWLKVDRPYFFHPSLPSLLIVLEVEDRDLGEAKSLSREIKQLVESVPALEQPKTKFWLPERGSFREAELSEHTVKSNCVVLLYAPYRVGTVSSSTHHGFSKASFCLRARSTDVEDHKALVSIVRTINDQSLQFRYSERDTFSGSIQIAGSVAHLSLLFVGFAQCLRDQVPAGIRLFIQLLNANVWTSLRRENPAIVQLLNNLVVFYSQKHATVIFSTRILPNLSIPFPESSQAKVDEVTHYLDLAESHGGELPSAYIWRGVRMFLRGDVTRAFSVINKAVRKFPDSDAVNISLAFLFAFQDEEAECFRILFGVSRPNPDTAAIFQAVEFSTAVHAKYPAKRVLMLHIGMLNVIGLDRSSGREQLHQYLQDRNSPGNNAAIKNQVEQFLIEHN